MALNPKSIRALLRVLKDAGVSSAEFDGFKVAFGPPPRAAITESVPRQSKAPGPMPAVDMDPETLEMLTWHVGGGRQ